SPMLSRMLNIDADPSENTIYWTDFFPEQDWKAVAQSTQNGQDVTITHYDSNAQPCQFALRVAIVNQSIEGSLQDITARAETYRQLRLMADNDPVTNVLNPGGTEKALGGLLSRRQDDKPCLLAYLDLKRIKYVNGTFGHSSGDALLLKVCEQLESVLRSNDKIGRIGSDELVIICEDCEPDQARTPANCVLESLTKSPFLPGNGSFHHPSTLKLVE